MAQLRHIYVFVFDEENKVVHDHCQAPCKPELALDQKGVQDAVAV